MSPAQLHGYMGHRMTHPGVCTAKVPPCQHAGLMRKAPARGLWHTGSHTECDPRHKQPLNATTGRSVHGVWYQRHFPSWSFCLVGKRGARNAERMSSYIISISGLARMFIVFSQLRGCGEVVAANRDDILLRCLEKKRQEINSKSFNMGFLAAFQGSR
jgi:hypothetical protein